MTCQDLGGGRVLSDPEGTSLRSSGSPREHSLAAAAELVPVSHANIEKNALLAPIYKLPMELLAEIFSLACEFTIYELVEGFPTILTISYACRLWRDVIHGLPELWARLPLYVLYDTLNGNIETPFSYHAIARRAQLIIKRCGDTPLESCVQYDADNRDMWTELDEVLFEHTRLWGHLALNTSGLFRDDRKPLPSLQRLDTYSDYITPQDDPECTLLHAKQLRALGLTNRYHPLPALAPLPWAQLTSLRTTMHAAAGLAIIDICPALEQWDHYQPAFQTSIEEVGPQNAGFTQSARLRSLTLSRDALAADGEEILQILDHLRTPQLESWHFIMDRDGPTIRSRAYSFLLESGCRLRSLVWSECVPDGDLCSFLRSQPFESLEELDLRAQRGAPIVESFIAGLALPALPQMRRLTLKGDVVADKGTPTIRKLITGRVRVVGTFELRIIPDDLMRQNV
ncbi:hypothetical protein GGF50DRAFT_109559 [Schizophyllum commune]